MNNNLRIFLIFICWCLVFTITHFYILTDYNFKTELTAIDAVITNLTVTLVNFGLFFLIKNYPPKTSNFIQFVGILIVAVSSTFYIQKILFNYFIFDLTYINFITATTKIRIVFNFLLIVSNALISFSWFYIHEKQNENENLNENEKMLKEAELINLRQQLQPHFIFNSLNSISALLEINTTLAQKMIHELADFLRGTIKKETNTLVTFQTELNHLKLYLNIEKIRFEHRLEIVTFIEEETKNCLLPSLIIQPIVENAIKFGLYGTTEKIEITITSKLKNDLLIIEISNPFDNETTENNKGTGFGLNSISRRLYLLYTRNDLLNTTISNNLFITQILIPQKQV